LKPGRVNTRKDTSMAQKATTMGTTQTGTVKPRKTAPVVDGVTTTEVVDIPQSTREQYPEVCAAIERGLADVAAGRVHTRRSYAEYANIEIED